MKCLMKKIPDEADVIIIGGGFTGLSAAFELSHRGQKVVVIEKDNEVGGLAGSFFVGTERVEKYYHHWFTSDKYIIDLVKELDVEKNILFRKTETGLYFEKNIFRLSSPFDVLCFSPLGIFDRLRLGFMVLRARFYKNINILESRTAEDWLREIGGNKVYKVVWEPLLKGKFGTFASDISAVYFWNKLKLRGGSRAKGGAEMLAYFRGGFAALTDTLTKSIISHGGTVLKGITVKGLEVADKKVVGVYTSEGTFPCNAVIATIALPLIAELVQPHTSEEYTASLRNIKYLANVCLVLELSRNLSRTYWINVNDPDFPYIGIIEHTNFEPPETYGGRHIVYLSKYLPESTDLFHMNDKQIFEFSLPYIQRMFPYFNQGWVSNYNVWRTRYAQPIIVRNYSNLLPDSKTPLDGFYISSMAQIYPEDRGTNYAIREGRIIGEDVSNYLNGL